MPSWTVALLVKATPEMIAAIAILLPLGTIQLRVRKL
jgi:hypothetical protein